ncbi:MAG: hypothetical protein JO006_06710 [Paucibacter sp.]|nr:hypothetical protein [Roseateles sp.]
MSFLISSIRKIPVAARPLNATRSLLRQHASRLIQRALQPAGQPPQRSGFSLLVDSYGSRR